MYFVQRLNLNIYPNQSQTILFIVDLYSSFLE